MITIRPYRTTDQQAWDKYVEKHLQGTLYHLSGWKNVIEKTYSHKTYYLVAVNSLKLKAKSPRKDTATNSINPIVGILPLVHLKHFIFGNSLISIPYFDMGGILADNDEIEKALLCEAINLGKKLKVDNIELRHIKSISCLNKSSKLKAQSSKNNSTNYDLSAISHELSTMSNQLSAISYATKSHKVRMLLELPDSSEKLMKSFKSKLRSQIRKPMKEGLKSRIGGLELLDDFYDVFSMNMRDLGSPVHSKHFMKNVIETFHGKAKIVIIYKENKPAACSLIVGFKRILENPWSSALRKYRKHNPNMLLYWTMIEYACDFGYNQFDFGRSTPGEGTYNFKKQWGAKSETLHWHYVSLKGNKFNEFENKSDNSSKYNKAIRYWQNLPVNLTKLIGPIIRKHIGL